MGVNNFNVMSLGKARLIEPAKVGYKDSVEIIYDELNKTRKSFIKIGWYLKHIHDNNMYEQDGYANIYELAMEKFHFSQPTTTRYINLCEEFSVNHNSPELDQKYEDYNISQLFEMLSMAKNKIEQVTPDMTVSEIREIKKPSKEAIKTFYDTFLAETEFANHREGLKQYLVDKFGKSNSGGSRNGLIYDCSRKGIRLNGSSEITWASFAKSIDELIPVIISKAADENNIPGQTSIENDFAQYLPDDYAISHNEQPSDIGSDSEDCNFMPDNQELENNGQEQIIDGEYREIESEMTMTESEEPKQSELPLLKNNDQRKKWLLNYKDWGLWYRDEHIDVNYYKYDFQDGSRLVVAEYPKRFAYWNNEQRDEHYYHLLEVNKKGYKQVYNEKYRQTTDSETYLIDFLKNLQK